MNLVYGIKDRPKFARLVLFAIQQVLAIMAATIAVPSVVNSVTGSELTASAAIFSAASGPVSVSSVSLIAQPTMSFANMSITSER